MTALSPPRGAGGPAAWIARHAALRPGRPALLSGGRGWSWAELHRAVQARAARLAAAGAGPGARVAVWTRDPAEARLLRWAAAARGAAECVLDPRLTEAELAPRLAVLRPALVAADPDRGPLDAPVLAIPRAWAAAPHAPAPLAADAPARVLFTTGSTGEPRAVAHAAPHLLSAARANARARGLRRGDVLLAALPPFHAAGSLFEDTVLWLGGTLALPAAGGAAELARALAAFPATLTSVVPAQLEALLDSPAARADLRRLRLLNYAGDSAPAALVARLLAAFPGEVTRGYGLTEAGPLVSVLGARAHRAELPGPGALGVPAPGVRVRVEEDGELRVRSGHVMLGYLHDPAATAERLRDGWLRTGDEVEVRDGALFLRGRLSGRIRSGAEWVHPAQVECALASLAGVRDAVVVAVPSPRWGERPVAFVRAEGPLAAGAVQAHLSARLSRPSWPDWIQAVPAYPLNASGKVDRRTLRDRAASGPPEGALVLSHSAP